MEIREQKSPFEACGKDAVQEWLVHPVTIELERITEAGLQLAREDACAHAYNSVGSSNEEIVAGMTRFFGSKLWSYQYVKDLLGQAKDYANGK